jgi:hypothetical protein
MTSSDAANLDAFRRLLAERGITVSYQVGSLTVAWQVLIGRSSYQASDREGVIEERDCRDFCGIAADLTIAGQPVIPQRGHRIIEPTPAGSDTYNLLPLESDKPYRYMDPGRLLLRVHTKRILTSDPAV